LTTAENNGPKIREINPASDRADQVADLLRGAVEHFAEDLGVDFAGFALVAWNMQGQARSIYTARRGMVGRSLVPSFVADNLSRHIAVDLVQEGNIAHEVTPPDDKA
jgi:hypothetical protein